MHLLPYLYNHLLDLCPKKRARTPPKSENLINLKRKRTLSSYANSSYLSTQDSSFVCDSYIPITPRGLYNDLVRDPTSVSNIRSVVNILNDVQKQTDIYLSSCMKNKYIINNHAVSSPSLRLTKKYSKLQGFLNDHDIEDITADEIKSL